MKIMLHRVLPLSVRQAFSLKVANLWAQISSHLRVVYPNGRKWQGTLLSIHMAQLSFLWNLLSWLELESPCLPASVACLLMSHLLPAPAFSSGCKPDPAFFCSQVPRSTLPGAPHAHALGSKRPLLGIHHTSYFQVGSRKVSALFYYLKWFSIQYEFLLLGVCLGRAICQHKTVKVPYFLYITESFPENWKSRKDFFFL